MNDDRAPCSRLECPKWPSLCALLAALLAPAVADAAPATAGYYCSAEVEHGKSKTLYMTGIFHAAADPRDVNSAWQQYVESQHIDARPGSAACGSAPGDAQLDALRTMSRTTMASLKEPIVDVAWAFTGQVPPSQAGTLYGYCYSGTSVANATYFSDVFGATIAEMPSLPIGQFFQDVRARYGNPPGLGTGTGPGPAGTWCPMIGNIADAERDKKAVEDKLRSPTRQIVETGWRFVPTAATPPAGPSLMHGHGP